MISLVDPAIPSANDIVVSRHDQTISSGSSEALVVSSVNATSPEDLEQLGDEIAELTAHLHATTWRLLVRLREFDEREGWSGGFASCAHWLSWRTGIAPGAAREKVRVARAIAELPRLSAAMERGELPFS